jgi:hypothetical protein
MSQLKKQLQEENSSKQKAQNTTRTMQSLMQNGWPEEGRNSKWIEKVRQKQQY